MSANGNYAAFLILGGVVTVLLGLFSWLLKRSIDKQQKETASELKEVKDKTNKILVEFGRHDEKIKRNERDIEKANEKLNKICVTP